QDQKRTVVRRDRFHEQVRMMYSWADIARRTERVYDLITGNEEQPSHDFYSDQQDAKWRNYGKHVSPASQSFALIDRLKRYYGCGIWAGKLFVLCVVVDYLLFVFLELCFPRSNIDICRDWPKKKEAVDASNEVNAEENLTKRTRTVRNVNLEVTKPN
ncbi:phosphatidylinositol glycan, class A, partial [Aureobasidium melanogenum]